MSESNMIPPSYFLSQSQGKKDKKQSLEVNADKNKPNNIFADVNKEKANVSQENSNNTKDLSQKSDKTENNNKILELAKTKAKLSITAVGGLLGLGVFEIVNKAVNK